MRRNKIVILPQLNDCGGDLSASWFVYYSCRNPQTNRMERFRIYTGFSSIPTPAGRRAHAEKIIKEWSDKLLAGWTPWHDDKLVIYEDQVMYANIAKNFGRRHKDIRNVRVLASRFLTKHRSQWADKSFGTYQSKLRIFTQWCEQQELIKRDITVMTHGVLVDFFNFLVAGGMSDRTIKKYKSVLRWFFAEMVQEKIIHVNPVLDITVRGKIVDQAPKPILKDDMELLKAAIQSQDPQLWLACQFQFYCFIRPGTELRLLKMQDVNLHAQLITITSVIAKNRRTETVQIPSHFAKLLTSSYRLQDCPKDFYVFGKHGHPGPEPMGRNNFRVRFNKIRDQLNLSKDYKWYSWKHTGATAAVDAGIPERHLMNQLRHKSFESTDHYFRRHVGYRSPAIDEQFPEI